MQTAPRFPFVSTSDSGAPGLMVVVDTEEAFDWTKPFSRSEVNVDHIQHQDRAQAIFARHGVRPTYVVDYAVASQEAGYRALREWLLEGKCQVGAHLHPWVNPPFDEELSTRNSYPGNLPEALEREKLARLTETIEINFKQRPTVYKAGRYGIGPATGGILEELGYAIDTSVVPRTDFRRDAGPDFSDETLDPYWFGPTGAILEIPLTVGWCGRLRGLGATLQPGLMSPLGMSLHLPGILARAGLFERIRLTPEGTVFEELRRVTDTLLAEGVRLFNFTYHSPSLAPGNTPYVRDRGELERFLALIERYCAYFMDECGGTGTTPHEVLNAMLGTRPAGSPVPFAAARVSR